MIRGHLACEKEAEEMAERTRRAAAFRAKAVLEASKGAQTVAALAARFEIHRTLNRHRFARLDRTRYRVRNAATARRRNRRVPGRFHHGQIMLMRDETADWRRRS